MAPIPTPRLPLWLRALHSSARYAATASVRGLLVAGIQVFVPYRIHPSIHLFAATVFKSIVCMCAGVET